MNKDNWFKKGNKIRNTGRTRFKKGQESAFKGRHHSEESRLKTSSANKDKIPPNKGIYGKVKVPSTQGDNHWNWKGGITSENKKFLISPYYIRTSSSWEIWRKAVFQRDNFTCQDCGIRNKIGLGFTIQLFPHHLISVEECIETNKKELIFDINNGITVCFKCHKKRHGWK